jgi:hypothetical protein
MYLPHPAQKDGKVHRYWRFVRSVWVGRLADRCPAGAGALGALPSYGSTANRHRREKLSLCRRSLAVLPARGNRRQDALSYRVESRGCARIAPSNLPVWINDGIIPASG